ncbi:MAG: sulfite exporter TauE/SafE family protein [Candidatus Lokiarchaeota archaeon]|nr:sulfite exporter TauE/SafE family protein [Candidatus Lokiarchaeota archaeon]
MEPWLLLVVAIAGFAIAFLASMVGIAGAILFLPVMILCFMIQPSAAIGASTFAGAASTTAAAVQYLASKKVNFRLAVIFIALNLPGVFFGTWLAGMLESRALAGYCGLLIIGLAIVILINRNGARCNDGESQSSKVGKDEDGTPVIAKRNPGLVFSTKFVAQSSTSSFLGGFVTGFGGMGGATVTTCSMLVIGVSLRAVVGASIFAAAVTYWSSAITRALMPGFDWALAAALAVGAGAGAVLGARYHEKVKTSLLRAILSGIALFAGIQLTSLLFGF